MPISLFKHDPGPCPVDDAPHTTCTSPDYVPTIAAVQLPARDGVIARGQMPHGVITTVTYTKAAWRAAVEKVKPR